MKMAWSHRPTRRPALVSRATGWYSNFSRRFRILPLRSVMGLPSPPSLWRRLLIVSLIAVGLPALAPPPADAQADRRKRSTPGLVLDLGARHGACDELIFTPDGKELLAAGDDKVVRCWRVAGRKLDADHPREVRWPIYREWRGNIYGMALAKSANGDL